MTRASVALICAREPLVGALLGMLAEVAQYAPAFPEPHERPEDALARVRPLVVVLLDGSLEAARSDLFFALAAKRRVGIVIFDAHGHAPELAALALRRGIPWLEMPSNAAALRRVLDAAVSSRWWRGDGERRQAQRRQRATPGAERGPDGRLVYLDGEGRRWFVYDRRAGDRRRGERREEHEWESTRIFVRDDGESRSCVVNERELDDVTPSALGGQLARATRV